MTAAAVPPRVVELIRTVVRAVNAVAADQPPPPGLGVVTGREGGVMAATAMNIIKAASPRPRSFTALKYPDGTPPHLVTAGRMLCCWLNDDGDTARAVWEALDEDTAGGALAVLLRSAGAAVKVYGWPQEWRR